MEDDHSKQPNSYAFLLRKLLIGIPFLYLFLLIAVHVVHFIEKGAAKKYTVDSSWVQTVGVLTKIDHGPKGTGSWFTYEHNGTVYSNLQSFGDVDVMGNVKGEKYMVKVNPQHPELYFPIDWQPVFLPGENVDTTMGSVVCIKDWRKQFKVFFDYYDPLCFDTASNYVVRFKYSVKGKEYEREQELSPYLDSLNGKIQANQTFVVIYQPDLPERSILLVEQPSLYALH